MDPYLERPGLWPDVHVALISGLQDHLVPRVPERYYVAVEVREYTSEPEELAFVGRADVGVAGPGTGDASGGEPRSTPQSVVVVVPLPESVREAYLEVRESGTDEVVTVIEVLSPKNKRRGEGRRQYETKRLQVLGSLTNLIEIDLLRAGDPMPVSHPPARSDYRILVSRGERRPKADLIPFGVQDEIPRFPLPLRRGDVEPEVDIAAVLRDVYSRKGYERRVDYGQPPVPPFDGRDAEWADALLRKASLR